MNNCRKPSLNYKEFGDDTHNLTIIKYVNGFGHVNGIVKCSCDWESEYHPIYMDTCYKLWAYHVYYGEIEGGVATYEELALIASQGFIKFGSTTVEKYFSKHALTYEHL